MSSFLFVGGSTVDMPEFLDLMDSLTIDEIKGCATRIRDSECVADEVACWHTILLVDQALRGSGRARAAGVAASQAAAVVRVTAERNGVSLPDPEVTCVARAAAGVARALVAGIEHRHLGSLLRPWGLAPDADDLFVCGSRPLIAAVA